MFGFAPEILAVMAMSIFVGGIVKGITGVALPVVTMVIVVNFVEPHQALALIVLSVVVTNVWQAFRTGSDWRPIKRFWPLLVPFVIGLYLGSLIVADTDPATMFLCMGIATLVFTVSEIWKPRPRPLSFLAERILGPIAGILGGLLGGISTIWGPPIMMFMFMLHLPKDEWVRTIAIIWLAGAIPLVAFYIANGVLNAETAPISAAACIPAMLGILVGERLRGLINEQLFRKMLLIALFLVALNLIRRGIF